MKAELIFRGDEMAKAYVLPWPWRAKARVQIVSESLSFVEVKMPVPVRLGGVLAWTLGIPQDYRRYYLKE